MATFFICVLTALVLISLCRAIYLEDELEILHFWAMIIVTVTAAVLIVLVNRKETIQNSKTLVKPRMEIKTEQKDSTITKSDTTYVYTFKNID